MDKTEAKQLVKNILMLILEVAIYGLKECFSALWGITKLAAYLIFAMIVGK